MLSPLLNTDNGFSAHPPWHVFALSIKHKTRVTRLSIPKQILERLDLKFRRSSRSMQRMAIPHQRLLVISFLLVCLFSSSQQVNHNVNVTNRVGDSEGAESAGNRREEPFGRFIKFSTDNKDSIQIELEFSVPFVKLPIRREDSGGILQPPEPISVNVRGLLLAAGLGAMALVVVPMLTGGIIPPHVAATPAHVVPPPNAWKP